MKLVKESLQEFRGMNENLRGDMSLEELIGDSYFYYGDTYQTLSTETIRELAKRNIHVDDELVLVFSYGADNWNEIIATLERENIPYYIGPDEDGEEGESILLFNKRDYYLK